MDASINSTFWSIILIFSYFGWGYVVQMLTPEKKVSLGILPVWGAAASTVFFLWAATLTNFPLREAMRVWTLLGIALALFSCVQSTTLGVIKGHFQNIYWSNHIRKIIFLFILVGCVWRLSVVQVDRLNLLDDDLAYIPLAENLLTGGGLYDPFSFRRKLSFGGQSVLNAMNMLYGGDVGIQYTELVTFYLIWIMLVFSLRPTKTLTTGWLSIIFLCVITRYPVVNSASLLTSLVFLTGFVGTWRASETSKQDFFLPLLLCGAALVSLRAYLIPLFILFLLYNYVDSRFILKQRSLFTMRRILVFLFVLLLISTPWGYALYKTSGTPLFPFITGSQGSGIQMGEASGDNLFFGVIHYVYFWLCLAGVAGVFFLVKNALVRALYAVTVVGIILFAGTMTADVGPFEVYRYMFPWIFAFIVLFTSTIFPLPAKDFFQKMLQLRHVTVMISFILLLTWIGMIFTNFGKFTFADLIPRDGPGVFAERSAWYPLLSDEYKIIRKNIPAQSTVLVGGAFPYLMGYSKDLKVLNLDFPGMAAPPRSKVDFSNAKILKEDLKKIGVQYLVLQTPRMPTGIYSTNFWQKIWLTLKVKGEVTPYGYLGRAFEYMQSFFGFIHSIESSQEKYIIRTENLLLVDISKLSN